MQEIRQVLDQVCDLLGKLPGIAVLRSELAAENGCIELVAQSFSAIEVLQHMALAANVRLAPWLRQPTASIASPVKQTLIASTTPRDLVEFGELQLLGIHLVWHLHNAQLLGTSKANSLLQKWRAAAVGA